MVDQETYNDECDEFINKNSKTGIKLMGLKFEHVNIKIPDEPLNIDLSKARLKIDTSAKAIVKEFKPRKKIEDEPIW